MNNLVNSEYKLVWLHLQGWYLLHFIDTVHFHQVNNEDNSNGNFNALNKEAKNVMNDLDVNHYKYDSVIELFHKYSYIKTCM